MITKTDAIVEAIRTALAEPTRTNNGACRYLKEDGTVNCIASQVLFNLGVPTNVLGEGDPDQKSFRMGKRLTAHPLISAYAEEDAIQWLADLQWAADNGWKRNSNAWDGIQEKTQGTTMWAEALRIAVG